MAQVEVTKAHATKPTHVNCKGIQSSLTAKNKKVKACTFHLSLNANSSSYKMLLRTPWKCQERKPLLHFSSVFKVRKRIWLFPFPLSTCDMPGRITVQEVDFRHSAKAREERATGTSHLWQSYNFLLRKKRLKFLILRVKRFIVKLKHFMDVKEVLRKKVFEWVRCVTKSKSKSCELLGVTLVFPGCSIYPPEGKCGNLQFDLALESQWITGPGGVEQDSPWTFMSEDPGSKCSLKL